jgi:hypothetical protein
MATPHKDYIVPERESFFTILFRHGIITNVLYRPQAHIRCGSKDKHTAQVNITRKILYRTVEGKSVDFFLSVWYNHYVILKRRNVKMKMEIKSIYDMPLKVTFYERVNTHRTEQETSIENQVEYFKEFIKNNPNWEYVEGYVDIVSGESAESEKNFQKMISDGESGMFDLILTKEISRFACNTLDSLTYTRQLLNAGVGVYFQNDNLCTIEPDSELRLAIISSIAQDEVCKMSDRIHFGNKRSTESGSELNLDTMASIAQNQVRKMSERIRRGKNRSIESESELNLATMASIAQNQVRKMSDCIHLGNKRSIESESELHLDTMASIAQNQVRKMSDRIHRGKKHSTESGNGLGNS